MGSILISQIKNGDKVIHDTELDDITDFYSIIDDIEDIVKDWEPAKQTNIYYTLAPCKPTKKGSREQDGQQNVIPFDIDHVDPELDPLDYVKTACDAIGIDWTKTFAMFSGNGVQFFVEPEQMPELKTKNDYRDTKASYAKLCDAINEGLAARGLIKEFSDKIKTGTDVSVWSASRLMRMPGTWNKKRGKEAKKTRVLKNNLGPQSITIERAIKTVSSKGPTTKREFEGETIVDADYVKEQCQFLNHSLKDPKSLRFDEWMTAATLLHKCDVDIEEFTRSCQGGGSDTVNNWDDGEISRRCEDRKNTDNPKMSWMSCEVVESRSVDNEKCSTCPWKGKVKGPLQLQSTDHGYLLASKIGFWARNAGGEKSKTRADYPYLQLHFSKTTNYSYLPAQQSFYTYGKGVYNFTPDDSVKAFPEVVMDPAPDTRIVNEFFNKAKRNEQKDQSWFTDSCHGWVNFKNCALNLKTGEVAEHSPDRGFTWQYPFDYNPEALCPTFDYFLESTQAKGGERDEDAEWTILELMGDALGSGTMRAHYFAIHYGPSGANGKSTFMKIMSELTAGAVVVFTPEQVVKDSSGFNKQRLDGAKVIQIPEVPNYIQSSKDFWNELKNLSEGGLVMVARKGKPQYAIRNEARVHLDCNSLPRGLDDGGFNRRVIPLGWMNNFADDADPWLVDKMTAEMSGIFNKAYAGLKRLQKNHMIFTTSEYNKKLKASYLESNDPVKQWLKEEVQILDLGEKIPVEDHTLEGLKTLGVPDSVIEKWREGEFTVPFSVLYNLFEAWAHESELKYPPLKKRFKKKLEEIFSGQDWRFPVRGSSRAERAVGLLIVGLIPKN